MITDLDILTEFYKLINVADVITTIDGKIYKAEKPIDRTSKDIVVGCLYNRPSNNNHLFTGVVNINCFCQELDNHTPDNINLNIVSYAVLKALNIVNGFGNSGLLSYTLDSIKTFRDQDDLRMYYTNIRLDYTYKTK